MVGIERRFQLFRRGVDLLRECGELFDLPRLVAADRCADRSAAGVDAESERIGLRGHGRQYLAARHIKHRFRLDMDGLAVVVEIDLAAGLEL